MFAHPLTMGLTPAPVEDWLAAHPNDGVVLAQRRSLIEARGGDVIASCPEATGGIVELADTIAAVRGIITSRGTPELTLAAIGRAVAYDVCLLTNTQPAVLGAAVVCFPNRWRLHDKIGKSLRAVHIPVPDYATTLSDPVDRFINRLQPMRHYVRSNWGVTTSTDLFTPELGPSADAQQPEKLFVRREDQSLVRLPATGTVVFSIRTTMTPWQDLSAPERDALVQNMAELSPAWRSYKSIRDGRNADRSSASVTHD